jgi:predicted Zn-dependent protease
MISIPMNTSHIWLAERPRTAGVPTSLSAPTEFLSRAECQALFDHIVTMTSGGGETSVNIISKWRGSAKWARSRMYVASDARTYEISITRNIRGAGGRATTTRLDAEGLRQAVRDAEESLTVGNEAFENMHDPFIDEPILRPVLWDDSAYGFGADRRTKLVQELMEEADTLGLLTAGNLVIGADGNATIKTDGILRYYPTTTVECSMTVRDPKGTASGWAGVNHYALNKIDPKKLAATALDKCRRMDKPSAVEPGRYTVILEPQATADLFTLIVDRAMERRTAELPMGPFGKAPGRSKIGEQVLDRRMIMRSDPMDPDGAFLPYEQYSGTPHQPVDWINRGVLRELAYNKGYALAALNLEKALPNSYAYRLTGMPGVPTSTIDEMIAKTQRGILVTRLFGVQLIDFTSMLCGGYTRDGIWLIENGKITRPVKNFRFTESPLFVLNKLEDIGVPQRVFAPGRAIVAPAIRVSDFSFTSLADAV